MHWITSTEKSPWTSRLLPRSVRPSAPTLECGAATADVWEGFGGCFNELGWIALSRLSAAARRKVLASFFCPGDGLGLTIGRIPIGASDYAAEWYSCNEEEGDLAMRRFSIARDQKHLLPYIQEALSLEPELRFFASPWSPPTWMKFPKAHNYGTLRMEPDILRAYALYFVKFVQAYGREGVRIAQIYPQNEPVADQKFPSCVWTGEELRLFIRDYLGPALKKHCPDVALWLGTLNTADYDRMILPVLMDARARAFLSGVGFQWDGKGAVQRTRQSFPGLKLMQTENECGDGQNTWAYAEYVFGLLQHYLTNGTTSYVYWNLVLEPGGRSTWGWRQNSLATVDPLTRKVAWQPEYTLLKHFCRFIRPGDRRIDVTGAWSGKAVAFEKPDGRRVAVAHNPLDEVAEITLNSGVRAFTAAMAPHSFHTFVLD